jgi:hypothetical protein
VPCLVAAVLSGAGVAAEQARDGLSFEQQVATSIDRLPTGPVISAEVWRQGQRIRLEQRAAGERPAAVLILRLDQGRAFRLDPALRVAREIDLAAERARAQIELGTTGDRIGARPRVARIRGQRKVAGRACQGYRLTTDAGAIDVWLSDAIPADMGTFADYLEWLGADDALGPLLEALRRLSGFPLETYTRFEVSGRIVETRSTITRVRVGPLPDSLFELPADYRVEPAPAKER